MQFIKFVPINERRKKIWVFEKTILLPVNKQKLKIPVF
jgi:hypothetical protein